MTQVANDLDQPWMRVDTGEASRHVTASSPQTLPNGASGCNRAYAEGLQSASLGIWITAGGRHERAKNRTGLPIFWSIWRSRGPKRATALEIAETIENVGGYINAYTSREMTAFYARVLADGYASRALDVFCRTSF